MLTGTNFVIENKNMLRTFCNYKQSKRKKNIEPHQNYIVSLTYAYYIKSVDAVMRHQKLHLTCTEPPRSCTACKY